MAFAFFAFSFLAFCSLAYLYYTAKVRLQSYKPMINLNTELKKQEESLAEAKEEYEEIKKSITQLSRQLTLLNEESHLASSGFYHIKYDFQNSKDYEVKLTEVREQQKILIQNGKAIICETDWVVSGSKALGKKMTERNIKLGLSAFNVQCDNEILKVQFSTIGRAEEKMEQIRESINKLLEPNSCQVTDNFFQLKLEELHLVYAAHEKDKQEQNELRLKQSKMKSGPQNAGTSGSIYVLSNLGGLGENIFKIGMTKNSDPVSFIRQLGDESLPFDFDFHGMIYSDQAEALIGVLHQELRPRRVNLMNQHKDFFNTSLSEIEELCRKHYKKEFKLTAAFEAKEWRQTMAIHKSDKKKAA